MKKVEAVVFDMDGVLFDTESVAKRAWVQVAQEKNVPNIESMVEESTGLNHESARLLFLEKYGDSVDFEAFVERSHVVMHQILDAEGMRLMPGVREILEMLRAQGIATGLASSTVHETILKNLEQAQLTAYFDVIIGGDQVQRGKPDPEIYSTACVLLGKTPKDCVAVEDSPNGMRAAAGAGMMAIMVPDQIAPTQELRTIAYAVCDSLMEVREMIQSRVEKQEGQEEECK